MHQLAPPIVARYWHTLDDGRIQCELCPHYCKLKNNQHGICYGRMNQHGELVTLLYGNTCGVAVDPIEKKPLYHFLPNSKVLSFGTIGCNLKCKFCQNWFMSTSTEINNSTEYSPKSIAQMAIDLGCQSVAFTYNEPTIFIEYAIDVAKECHALGLKTIAVTAGYINAQPRQELYAHLDAVNVDLKGFSESFYHKLTGASLAPVLDTLLYIKQQTNIWLEITTLLIPGENDSLQEIEQEVKWLYDHLGPTVPLHFTAFHPAHLLQNIPPTAEKTLLLARDIALKYGMHYVYAGNIVNHETNSTYCYHCHKMIIERDGFEVVNCQLDESGRCKFCQSKCDGVF